MRYSKLYLLLLLLVLKGCTTDHEDKMHRPNFVIIQADDLGWDDLPLNGNKYVQTPGLDKLASEAVEVSRFYVNPVCAPTRASLLTGRDFLLTGISHVHGGKDFINLNEKTFGNVFKAEGYKTGMWGKWHSGKTEGYFPWQRGFDEAYMAQLYKHKDSEGLLNGKHVKSNRWADEVIVDYAIDFVNRNINDPFVAYLSFLTCHAPLIARDSIVENFKDKGLSENLSKLYAMIEQMDNEILRFLDELSRLGLKENTLVIFISDNGPAVINNWLTDEDRKIRYASGYKGHKGNIWENGVKSPLLISYPRMLEKRKVSLLSDVTDIFPTIAEFAGIDLSKFNLELTGKSFAKNLIEMNYSRPIKTVFNYADRAWPPSKEVWTPRGIKNEYAPLSNNPKLKEYDSQIIFLITEDYKLLKNPSARESDNIDERGYMLVAAEDDPFEKQNLSTQRAEIFKELKNKLEKKYKEIASSKNAFQPVLFNLDTDREKRIMLNAPIEVSGGVEVASSYSYPWNKVGNSATFRIITETGELLKPVIKLKGDCAGNKYLIEIEGERSRSVSNLRNSLEFKPITIPDGESVLKLSVVSSSNDYAEVQFKELVFE